MEAFYWLYWPESEAQPYFMTLIPHSTVEMSVNICESTKHFSPGCLHPHRNMGPFLWAWRFLQLPVNSTLDLWVLARVLFRCILASVALLQPDLGHLETSSEARRWTRWWFNSPPGSHKKLYLSLHNEMQWNFLHRSNCSYQEGKVQLSNGKCRADAWTTVEVGFYWIKTIHIHTISSLLWRKSGY